MSACFIVEAVRSPIGKIRGALKDVRPDDLAAHVMAAAARRAGVDAHRIDEVYLGCANQSGEDNRNVARMAALLAGFPETVPGATVNRLCGSGLEAIIQGARQIQLGEADIVIAGGVESMTRAPWVFGKPADGFPSGKMEGFDTSLGWRFPNEKLAARFPLEQMGETAENVAERWKISREAQDEFAVESHRRAVAAIHAGAFHDEIVAVEVRTKRGNVIVNQDEGPRSDTTIENISKLKAAFRSGGTVTAANSSTLNDGAAIVVLMSESAVKASSKAPLARFVTSATAGVDPRTMGIGPAPATRKALVRAGWSMHEIDLIELNEAFAAQSIACIRDLELDPSRVNVNGGSIALGHPLGMSGARIVTTLVHAMKARRAHRGLASMCIGVGQGISALFETT